MKPTNLVKINDELMISIISFLMSKLNITVLEVSEEELRRYGVGAGISWSHKKPQSFLVVAGRVSRKRTGSLNVLLCPYCKQKLIPLSVETNTAIWVCGWTCNCKRIKNKERKLNLQT